MLITRLELTDWKSYRQATVPFQEGTNAIIGPNGAGKSTLLEAVGFCLFNYRAASLAQCLREGAEAGRVVVTMVSSFDERPYEVERAFTAKTTTRYRVLDPELGRVVVADGNEDVLAWLRQHLCVAPTAALEALFENAVGVPQGTYTAPFLQPAAARKAVFNPLLQVEEYGEAADRLMDTQRLLADRCAALREEIARAEGLLTRLPSLEDEESTLAAALATLAGRLQALEAELQQATAAVERWDAAERLARDAEARVERARAEEASQSRLLEVAQQALQEAVRAVARRDAAEPGHRAYLEAERALQALEARRTERDRLRTQRQTLEATLARLHERAAAIERALQETVEAEERVVALAPRVARQTELERARDEALARAREAAQAARDAATAGQEVARAEKDLRAAEGGLAQAMECRRRLAEARAEMEALAGRGEALNAALAAARAEVDRLRPQEQALAVTTGARCPVCEADLTEERRAALLARDRRELAALEEAIRTQEAERQASRARYRALSEEIRRAEGMLSSLPSEAEVARLRSLLADRQGALQEARTRADSLADADQEVAACEAGLAALGDPRRESQRYEDRASQRPVLEKEQAALQRQRAAAEAEAADLDAALEAFAALDAELQAAGAARAGHEAEHREYLANVQVAGQQEERRARAAEHEAARDAARQILAEAVATSEAARAAYDATEHARQRARANTLLAGVASARTEQEQQDARRRAVEDEIASLRAVAGRLASQRRDLAQQERLHDTVRLVRDLLRKAGPYITQQLVRHISRDASRLYGDIMGDRSGSLNWSEDYDVTLAVRGHERAFRQLSGGEQMTAALAVRLAALRETSAIDVALFDEPTAHLDPERRDALADSILQVKGFSQLFVISHDDTFERTAQNYVRITRDEHGSRLADAQEA